MVKEIISIHVGQAGNQIGFSVWELLCAEHGINNEGICECNDDNSFETFFTETKTHRFVPRSIYIDLEPTVVDQLRTGSFSKLYHPSQLINGNDDSSANFARGFNTTGRTLYNSIERQMQRQMEACDNVRCFLFFRALSGGSGSGLTAMIMEMFENHTKTNRFEFPIHPSPHFDMNIVSPYNSLLGEHFCIDEFDVGLVIDNEALFDACTDILDIRSPTMTSVNRILAQVCSNITAAARFKSDLFNDVTIVLTNLVPYPRIHFPLVSFAPLTESKRSDRELLDMLTLTRMAFRAENQLVKCDASLGKYMSCSLVYRGPINPIEVYQALCAIKLSPRYNFVDWCPTGFKVGIIDQPPLILESSKLGHCDQNVVMMTNNSAASCIWQRLAHKFHLLYSKRCFVHWYVGEGLEESEFCEALYNMATLAKDYEEVAIETSMFQKADETDGEGAESESKRSSIASSNKISQNHNTHPVTKISETDLNDDDQFNTSNINPCYSTEIDIITDSDSELLDDEKISLSTNDHSVFVEQDCQTTQRISGKNALQHGNCQTVSAIQVVTTPNSIHTIEHGFIEIERNNSYDKKNKDHISVSKMCLENPPVQNVQFNNQVLSNMSDCNNAINVRNLSSSLNFQQTVMDNHSDDFNSSDEEASLLSNLVSITSTLESTEKF